MHRRITHACSSVALSLLIGSSVLAGDVNAARKYVDEAKAQIESRSFDDAKSKLELAEAELEDVPADAKKTVVDSIAAVRKQISDAALEGNKIKYKRELTNAMDEAEGSIGNLVTWQGAENRLKELFENADAKAALGDDLTAAQKKLATFKKLNDRKAAAQIAEQVEGNVKQLETMWAENRPKIVKPETPGDKDGAITDVDRELQSTRESIAKVPADTEQGKALRTRVDKIGAEFTQLALADKVKEKVEELNRTWDLYKDDWAGWDKETTGPTFAEYQKESGETMSALQAPKTREFISRANSWIKSRDDDEDYKKLQSAAEIKAIYDKNVADRNTALAKMEKFADAILTEAEKATLDQNKIDAIKKFDDSLKNNLEGSTKLEAYDKRALVLVDKFEGKTKTNDAAAAAFYKESTEKAAAAWPAMKEKYSTTDGFDPNAAGSFKGKLIVITTDNLMGYKFKPGDFPFATTIGGMPIAGKFDPAVAAAVKDVETKMGRSLGDNDDDGKWEVIARVEGTSGKLTKRVNVEGKIKDDAGNEATVTGERAETVDAPVVTIVAAHCGPLAVSSK